MTLAALAALVVAAGLLVHRFGSGILGDVAGDALYAVLVYLLLRGLLVRRPRKLSAVLAIVFCVGVELLQLTGLPRVWAEASPLVPLVLGSGFDARDLIVYAAAVLVAAVVDASASRILTRPAR